LARIPKISQKVEKVLRRKCKSIFLTISGDRFLKKEWWDIKAPGMFTNRKFTKSPVNVSAGKKLSSDALKGRVYEANLGDLNGNNAYKNIQLVIDDASETRTRVALTNFYGMNTTTDHLCSLIRKWHSLIEASVDAKTSDGFLLRLFPIAFTKRGDKQLKATTYAKRSQIKQIRKKMVEVITKAVSKSTLKEVVDKLINEKIPVEITNQVKKIFPIQNCIIRKVKTIKRPRYDSKFY
jgi:small subunit ribosomal protein S3Ae